MIPARSDQRVLGGQSFRSAVWRGFSDHGLKKQPGGGFARKERGRSRAFPAHDRAALFPEPELRELRDKKDIYFITRCKICQDSI